MDMRFPLTLLVCLLMTQTALAAQHDPTRPQDVSPVVGQQSPQDEVSFAGIKVTAIFARDGHYMAIINGHTKVAGQRIGRLKVIAIDASGVTLAKGNQHRTFAINQLKIKQDVTHGF